MEVSRSLLTIAQLAERTGVPAGTLRMWESRHGFPVPTRLPSGHRRYAERDVDLIRAVVRGRAEGLSLRAAISHASARGSDGAESIFAGLREVRPDLQPMRLTKRSLLALTRAIEDEHCARAQSGILVGSFQTEAHYRRSERRWHELARTAELAVALAEFAAPRESPGAPYEVPIGPGHPLAREWTLVFQARDGCACLAGWEIPADRIVPDLERRFEVVWSPEPEAAQIAMTIAAHLMAPLAHELSRRIESAGEERAPASSPELRSAAAQARRMLSYLAGSAESSSG